MVTTRLPQTRNSQSQPPPFPLPSSHTRTLTPSDDAHAALALYYVSLGLNLIWVPLYAGQHYTRLALVDSAILTATTVVTAVSKSKSKRKRGVDGSVGSVMCN
jgi:hypothetical protein